MSGWLRFRWRLDRLAAVILGAGLSPVVAVLALLVRRHDSGPAFVRLERVGLAGCRFQQWKLRSMRPAGNGVAGPPITSAEDPRVTTLGRHLRRYRLDEIPQLLNVVTGEMALVGPRPETPSYVDLDDPCWQDVLQARPGIAGPSQVLVADWEADLVARSDQPDPYRSVVLPLKLGIDRWYVNNASPSVDLFVIVALVRHFLGSVDRARLHARVLAEVPEAALLRVGRAGLTSAGERKPILSVS